MTAIATSATQDTTTLISSAAAGDKAAFAVIVRAHHEDMRRVCVVVAGDETVADEAVAAAWAIAWRRIGSVRDPVRLRPWLVSVAVNEARQILRSKWRRSVIEVPVALDYENHGGGVDPAAGIAMIDLRNALGQLDPEDRALLAMRYIAGFEAAELAIATGRSASGTRARLARLLHRLQKELTDE